MAGIRRIAQRILSFGAGLSMALVFAIIFINSLRRYTTGKSLRWGEELPVYLAIYGVMFGIGLAYLQDSHVRFTVVADYLSARARRWLYLAIDLVMVAVGAVMAWSGYIFATRRPEQEASGLIGTAKDLAALTGLDWLVWLGRMGTWQAAIATGGVILTAAALIRFVVRVQER